MRAALLLGLFVTIVVALTSLETHGAFVKRAQVIHFPSVGLKLTLHSEGGVCGFGGSRSYKLAADQPGKAFRLICSVHEPSLNFDSEIPITLIEKFNYPKTIAQDIEAWTSTSPKLAEEKIPSSARDIEEKKHAWGSEYFWTTPSKGSRRFTYLCPQGATYCIKVVSAGLEAFTFSIEKEKSIGASE